MSQHILLFESGDRVFWFVGVFCSGYAWVCMKVLIFVMEKRTGIELLRREMEFL
jgi:hypothetical protein